MSRKQFQNKFDYSFKLLFLGSINVGKTSIIFRYVDDKHKVDQKPTIGIDYKTKTIEYKSKKIKLQIFDTSGLERFRALTKNYYQGTDGIILVFDLKSRETFEDISYWMKEINKNCDKNKIGLLLIGNKNDGDITERKINREEGLNRSNMYDFKYIETSALINDNIKESFDIIIDSIFEKRNIKIDELKKKSSKKVLINNNINKGKNVLNNNNFINENNQNNDNFYSCCHG